MAATVVTMLCVAVLFPFLMALAVQTVDASHGGLVFGIMPIATALVAVAYHPRAAAALVLDRLCRRRRAGDRVCATARWRRAGHPATCCCSAAVAVSAVGYAFSGRLTSQMPGWEVISWVLVIALPLDPAAALTMPADITHIALKPWLGLLYVALFSQWIGFFAWNAGMAMGGIARVSQIQLLQPFVTFALAAFFNDETITLQILLFAAAVVVTVAISTRTRAKAAPAPAAAGSGAASAGGVLIE